MRIKKIIIGAAGPLQDFRLEFGQSKIKHFKKASLNLLVGENGTGKTTILKYISRAFFDQTILSGFSLIYESNTEGVRLENILSEYRQPETYPNKVIVSTYSPFEQFDGLQKNQYNPTKYCYVGAMSTKNSYGSTTSLSTACMPILTTFYHPYDKKSSAIRELLREIGILSPPLVELRARSILKKRDYPNESDHLAHSLIDKIYNISSYCRNRAANGRNILVPPDVIEKYYPLGWLGWLEDVRELISLPRSLSPIQSLWFQTDSNSDPFPMKHLSSGQLSLFFRFFRMLEVIDDNSIILIDEPETHLHPRWAQKYINMIDTVFGEFESHFIIATHSPFIASDVPREYIIGLKENDHGKIEQYNVDDKTMGSDPKEVLQEVFNLDKLVGQFTLKIISDIYKLIDNYEARLDSRISDNLETASLLYRAKELYNELGESHEKYRIFLRLKALETRKGK
ncbi:AAA family ATPase [Paenibacillus glycanilyticus]|uniref:AAA family ATPase n=1 Tax=Paenibacillus glycanilyticus TaxID=126569 RepID=UPI00191018C5|nr:ATP-binding protein [Paenibacillus glycanilyticus]